jgi:hypothetical protein
MKKRTIVVSSVLLVHLVCAGLACAGRTDGLVAYYRFNGSANDESGNGNHGTVFGALPCTDRKGRANSAYCFDGEDDFIRVPSSASLKPPATALSVAAWVFVEH